MFLKSKQEPRGSVVQVQDVVGVAARFTKKAHTNAIYMQGCGRPLPHLELG